MGEALRPFQRRSGGAGLQDDLVEEDGEAMHFAREVTGKMGIPLRRREGEVDCVARWD